MTNATRAPRADSRATQERILEAAEKLFSERGFRGTSLRAIADSAEVNLAAAHYHFGSKAKLLEATLRRCVAPMNTERLRRLDALEAQKNPPGVSQIVRALVEPGLAASGYPALPGLMANLFAEPKSVSVPLLERTFRPIASRFFGALAQALPAVPEQALRWRFHLLVGAMIQLSNFNQPLNVFDPELHVGQGVPDSGIEELINFSTAGLCQSHNQEPVK